MVKLTIPILRETKRTKKMTESSGNKGSNGDVWQLTVAHGKQAYVVTFHPQHPQRMTFLKLEVEKLTGVAAKHQRLLYRGKELLANDGDDNGPDDLHAATKKKRALKAPLLVNNAKLMLLLNQAYHQDAAKRPVSSAQPAGSDEQASLSSSQEAPAPVEKKQNVVVIDVGSLDDDEVLVQAFRGKANYELILKCDDAVLAVKERVSGILGLSAQGIRLVVKGKTPKDDTSLSELLGAGPHVIKCMVLLQAQQHVVMEKEDDLRQLLNELTQLQVAAKRLEKQVARNFASRQEMTVHVSALVDGAQHVHGNLVLLMEHLSPSGGRGLDKPRANQQTADLLAKAIQDAQALCGLCEALLQRVTLM